MGVTHEEVRRPAKMLMYGRIEMTGQRGHILPQQADPRGQWRASSAKCFDPSQTSRQNSSRDTGGGKCRRIVARL